MSFLTKEGLLGRQSNFIIKKVELKDGHVFVREMSGYARNIFETSLIKMDTISGKVDASGMAHMDMANMKSKYAVMVLCDEKGNLLFTIEEATELGKSLSASELDTIVEVADSINNVFSQKNKDGVVKN